MDQRGAIYCEQAYAQGKMLDNSKWELPRKITPSDIDIVFDDMKHGRMLFVELSSRHSTWNALDFGQRRVYTALVSNGTGQMLAALATHSVPKTRKIDTKNDITHFQVMHFAACLGYATSPVYPGERWPSFVDAFYAGKNFSFPPTPPPS